MQDRINNAANTMDLVVSDLRASIDDLYARPRPPQGVSLADKALMAYLGQQHDAAVKLRAALMAIEG